MGEEQNQHSENLTFSQRYGYEPLPEPMRLETLSEDLRKDIWSVVEDFFAEIENSHGISKIEMQDMVEPYELHKYELEYIQSFISILEEYLKKPRDDIPNKVNEIIEKIKSAIFNGEFNRVFDLLEIIINGERETQELAKEINGMFEKYIAAYRLDTSQKPYRFFPCASKEQCDAIQQAIKVINESDMVGASVHLRKSAKHINEREYSESVADSIHAVESVARKIDPKASKTLGPALDSLEKSGVLKHRAFKEAFKKGS